jgi:hypothetical protein
MALGRRQVDQPALAEQMQAPAVDMVYSSTKPRIRRTRPPESSASAPLSISTSKWPALASTAPSFMTSMCSRPITVVSPVTVTNTSPIRAASRSGITR